MPKLINLLVYDLTDKIIAYIHEHQLPYGTKLPSERDLSEKFQVNRTTLRGALQKLVDNGILRTQTNSGYFLTEPKFEKNSHHYFVASDDSLLKKNQLQLKPIAISPEEAITILPEPNYFKNKYVKAYLEYIDGEAISLFLLVPIQENMNRIDTNNPFKHFKDSDYTRSQEISLITANEITANLLGIDKEEILLFITEEIRSENRLSAIALGYTISKRCTIQVNVTTNLQ